MSLKNPFSPAFGPSFGPAFGQFTHFTPPDLPGLTRWFDAALGVTLVSGFVSEWADQSGNGEDATQSTASQRPTVVASGLNGHPVLRWPSTGNVELEVDLTFMAGSDFTVYSVMQRSSNKTTNYFTGNVSGGVTNASLHIGWSTNTLFKFGFWGNDSNVTVPAFTSATPVIGQFTFSQTRGKEVQVFEGGVSYTVDMPAQTTPLTSVTSGRIGCAVGGTFFGDIAELLYWNRALTDAEEVVMNNYLANKYGITLP